MHKFLSLFVLISCSSSIFAQQDISGVWKTVDDKSGNPKALVEIKKNADNQYTGTIIKLFPPIGFKNIDICQNCPAPYSNQPMLGMEILKGLKFDAKTDSYGQGKILDPRQGKLYNVRVKLRSDDKRLHIRGYIGVSVLGRNQVWIRQ